MEFPFVIYEAELEPPPYIFASIQTKLAGFLKLMRLRWLSILLIDYSD